MGSRRHNGGLLSRRGSAAVLQRRASTGNISNEEDTNPCQGLWVYPEVMDVIALVAALSLGIGTAALFAFSYEEDIAPADARYVEAHKGSNSLWVSSSEMHPVSNGLLIFSTLSGVLSAFSLVLAVSVRILLTYVINMKVTSKKRQFLVKWANPLAVLDLLVWALSMMLTYPTLYFVAWVVFPDDIADHPLLLMSGSALCAAFVVLFFLGLYLLVVARRIGKQEEAEKENQSKACVSSKPFPTHLNPMVDSTMAMEEGSNEQIIIQPEAFVSGDSTMALVEGLNEEEINLPPMITPEKRSTAKAKLLQQETSSMSA